MIEHKTSTYMGFPNHSFLWAQWTSETMNLWTGKERGGGMNEGRRMEKKNQMNKPNKMAQA